MRVRVRVGRVCLGRRDTLLFSGLEYLSGDLVHRVRVLLPFQVRVRDSISVKVRVRVRFRELRVRVSVVIDVRNKESWSPPTNQSVDSFGQSK